MMRGICGCCIDREGRGTVPPHTLRHSSACCCGLACWLLACSRCLIHYVSKLPLVRRVSAEALCVAVGGSVGPVASRLNTHRHDSERKGAVVAGSPFGAVEKPSSLKKKGVPPSREREGARRVGAPLAALTGCTDPGRATSHHMARALPVILSVAAILALSVVLTYNVGANLGNTIARSRESSPVQSQARHLDALEKGLAELAQILSGPSLIAQSQPMQAKACLLYTSPSPRDS